MRRIVAVAGVLLLLLACQKQQESRQVKVAQVDGVPTVQNPAQPLRQRCPWQYQEDLVVSNEDAAPETSFVYVTDAVADAQGNIYVADARQKVVRVFDRRGHYVDTIGKPGEGPGEFSRPGSVALDTAGNLVIYDFQLRRVSWFDRSGSFIRSVSLAKSGWPRGIMPWGAGQLLVLISRPDPREPGVRRYLVAVVDTSGQQVDSLGLFFGGKVKRIRMKRGVVTFFTGYEPGLAWTVGPGARLCIGYGGEYRVSIYDSTGRLVRRIEREWEPTPIPEEKRQAALDRFTRVPKEIRDQIEIPATEPAYYDLFVDDLGYLWVRRTMELPYQFDVFDPEGEFVCVVTLDCSPLSWSDGYLYARRSDEATGAIELVRLKRVPTS